MDHYRASNHNALTPMVKNLIIINALMFLAKLVFGEQGLDLDESLALFNPASAMFRPWQILSHFFMHANTLHLFMNMFGLFMFGRMLEIRWGAKRFLFFYMATAFFAALLHFLVVQYQISTLVNQIPQGIYDAIKANDIARIQQLAVASDGEVIAKLYGLVNGPVLGASGAIFGILGACYVLFPNTILYLIFPPIPIRLKVAVTLYGLYELYRGLENSPTDNVAHFAHLGGLVAGIIIVKYWNKTRRDSFF
ncbi:MAG: rhomboid family intramembrane serine protease [Bacteroidia bacterium]|nr:rhomboid family intramembrane serine protease [Bacteroidia bacterium]